MMSYEEILAWINQDPLRQFGMVVLAGLLLFYISRAFIARGLVYLSDRTETQYDDIIVDNLKPFRLAWIVPLVVIYQYAYLLPYYEYVIQQVTQFLMLWVVVVTLNALLKAFNEIYESRPNFSGVSIEGYLDILKILFLMVAVILSVSIFTGQSVTVLLSGLGAIMAILLLVFQDTILSFVASLRISTNDLFKEGDWLEVPSYDADGDVIDISLYSVKIRNFDMTITVIPTRKMIEVGFKNWRGMTEAGGRRIKRSINLDISSVRFVDKKMMAQLKRRFPKSHFFHGKLLTAEDLQSEQKYKISKKALLGGPTNIGIFRMYIEEFLKNHPDLHHKDMALLVRQLEPSSKGLPLELYVFTKTTEWAKYEMIQAEIFDHLVATAALFDLQVYQEPASGDFAALAS